MSCLVIAEFDQGTVKESTLKAVTAASQLATEIDILLLGESCQSAAQSAAKISGIRQVIVIEHAALAHHLAEPMVDAMCTISDDYDCMVMPATTQGKNLLPRLAAKLDVQPITDVISIVSDDTFVRPIYAGNALATVQTHEPKRLISIRLTAFSAATVSDTEAAIEIKEIELNNQKSCYVSASLNDSSRPELTSAKTVVSGGRGLQNKDNFALIESLADKLGAAVGASRAAVDAGFVPNDYQVGQTGKVVAPALYIAIGISGAIQHLAGMKDSKIIVAINKDEEAPIFQVADFGLVGDLFQIIPEIMEKLS